MPATPRACDTSISRAATLPQPAGLAGPWLLLPYPIADQLDSYFAGHLRSFDLPLHPQGTAFQRKSLGRTLEIPTARTISYLELARRSSAIQTSVRAVWLGQRQEPPADRSCLVTE